MPQIQACSYVGKWQHSGVFDDGAAIDFSVPLNRAATGNHGAGANTRQRSDKSKRQNSRAFFYQRAGSDPDAWFGFFSGGAGLRLASENIYGELPQITMTGQRIEISLMLQARAFTAAVRELCAEERCSVISARSADAENLQRLGAPLHLGDPALLVEMTLDQLFKVGLSVVAQPD